MNRKQKIGDSAENLGKEVGGFIFREAFESLVDVIKDAFSSDEENSGSDTNTEGK